LIHEELQVLRLERRITIVGFVIHSSLVSRMLEQPESLDYGRDEDEATAAAFAGGKALV
jgi:hypothetical protein